jgi:hypothetical protein
MRYPIRLNGVIWGLLPSIYNLFTHPYTKIEFLEHDLNVSRLTAAKYLEALVSSGFLFKQKIGRTNYYMNPALTRILTGENMRSPRS